MDKYTLNQLGRITLCGILATLFFWIIVLCANAETLKASWYSIESLKKERTFKYSKGVMANGKLFQDDKLTSASCDFPLNTWVRVTNLSSGHSVVVCVTDRTNKRFKGKRIDLSKGAFEKIGNLKDGLLNVKVEVIK